jgi:hypothetical protein
LPSSLASSIGSLGSSSGIRCLKCIMWSVNLAAISNWTSHESLMSASLWSWPYTSFLRCDLPLTSAIFWWCAYKVYLWCLR